MLNIVSVHVQKCSRLKTHAYVRMSDNGQENSYVRLNRIGESCVWLICVRLDCMRLNCVSWTCVALIFL